MFTSTRGGVLKIGRRRKKEPCSLGEKIGVIGQRDMACATNREHRSGSFGRSNGKITGICLRGGVGSTAREKSLSTIIKQQRREGDTRAWKKPYSARKDHS